MEVSTLRRLASGLGANGYSQLVTIVVQLMGVPIFLNAWGPRLYGEWLILFAIPAYFSISDLGFSQSAANDMTGRVARHDVLGALAVFQTLGALVSLIATLGLLLCAALVTLLPIGELLHIDTLERTTCAIIVFVLAGEVFIGLFNGVLHAGFRAGGDYALHTLLNGNLRLVQFASSWAAALLGGGPLAAAIAFLSVRAVATPCIALLLTRRQKWIRFGLSHASLTQLHYLMKPAIANIAVPVANALNIQGLVLLVGAVLGPSAVVVFSTLRTLTRSTAQAVLAVSHATEPELAAAFGSQDRPLMRSLYLHSTRAAFWLSVAAGVILVLFGAQILRAWTGGRVPMNFGLFGLLLASGVATVLWYVSFVVLRSANGHLRIAIAYVLISGSSLVLAGVLLAFSRELLYVGIALLLMNLLMAVVALTAASRLLHIRLGKGLLEALNPLPLIAIVLRRRYVR